MNLLIIGGSSFIGRNLIEKLPYDCNIRATYNSSKNFKNFVKNYSNVEPIKLDLFQNNIPNLGNAETILYLAGISPGLNSGHKINGLNLMDFLHAKAVSLVFENTCNCERFIYFSSGIYYLLKDYSDYRKSRILGEENVKLNAQLNNCHYVIIRNMEIYGQYMADHKIYRKICNAAINGLKEININGDGKNLIDTMYIDDYEKILIKLLKSNIQNDTIDICKSSPITIRELIYQIYEVVGCEKPKINFQGTPTENTNFILNNEKMIKMFGFNPKISLQTGLKKWIDGGLK